MKFEILMDGECVVNVDVNATLLSRFLAGASSLAPGAAISTPATKEQLQELLSRIDPKSQKFLKQIAASRDGTITWRDMRSIFGISDDWSAFSAAYGKGITRAFRHILGNKSARLVWWDDDTWDEVDTDSAANIVSVDGPALAALREAAGLAKA